MEADEGFAEVELRMFASLRGDKQLVRERGSISDKDLQKSIFSFLFHWMPNNKRGQYAFNFRS